MSPAAAVPLTLLALLLAISCSQIQAAPWLLTIRNGPVDSYSQIDLAFETAHSAYYLPSLITQIYPASTFVYKGKRGKFISLVPVGGFFNDNVLNASAAPFFNPDTRDDSTVYQHGLAVTTDFGGTIVLTVQVGHDPPFLLYADRPPYYTFYTVDAQLTCNLAPTATVPTPANWKLELRHGPPAGFAYADIWFETDKSAFPSMVISVDITRSYFLYDSGLYNITGLAPLKTLYNDNILQSSSFPFFSAYIPDLGYKGVAFTTNKPLWSGGYQQYGVFSLQADHSSGKARLLLYDYLNGVQYFDVGQQVASNLISVAHPPPPHSPPPRPPSPHP